MVRQAFRDNKTESFPLVIHLIDAEVHPSAQKVNGYGRGIIFLASLVFESDLPDDGGAVPTVLPEFVAG